MTDTVVYKGGNGHFIDTADLPYWISQGWREGPVPGTSVEPPVTLTTADLDEALLGYAKLLAPTFTGVVTAPGLTLTGGSPGAGKVLVSDAGGSATWQSLAGTGDATSSAKGVVQLAGDLGGTAASPTVPGLANKAPTASPTFTGTVTAPAIKVTGGSPAAGKLLTSDSAGNATWAALSDASTGAKGVVQLAGDLGGTAASPTVPGLASKENTSAKGAANGYAPLDASALVPAVNLPSYVDDVLEYANLAGFPGTGTAGKIFVALDTGKIYRWSGSVYVEISPSPGSTDSVTEGSSNLYYTDARAQAANSAALALKSPIASPTFTGTATTPALKVTGGSPAAGKLLTSDASGNATWTAPADATTGAKGVVQLAGDLGGTAASPTVPGLANKAPTASPTFTGTVTTPALAVTGGSPGTGKVLTSDASGNATWATPAAGGSQPYSEAYVAGSTVITASNSVAVQSGLTATVTDAAHTFATDGITVPAGFYIVTVEAVWNTGTTTYSRCPAIYDGTTYRLIEGIQANTSTTQSYSTMIELASSTKLQIGFYVSTTTTSARTLAAGNGTRIVIRKLA